MAIEIINCNGGLIRDLVKLYNEAIRHIPHCYPVGRREFATALAPAMGGAPDVTRHDEAILAAMESSELLGFVHMAIGKPELSDDEALPEPDAGLLRFLWYRPGSRHAGEALLDAAEEYWSQRHIQTVAGFLHQHNYNFYHLPPARLSDRIGHIGALLGIRGYEIVTGGVFLDWRNFSVPTQTPDPWPVTYEVEHVEHSTTRPGITLRAFLEGQQIGIGVSVSCAERSHARRAQEWLYTEWLDVEVAYQGRGLGRALLQRTLHEARKLGYRHAVISTGWRNYRAYSFFTNFGYRVSDWTYAWTRALA